MRLEKGLNRMSVVRNLTRVISMNKLTCNNKFRNSIVNSMNRLGYSNYHMMNEVWYMGLILD